MKANKSLKSFLFVTIGVLACSAGAGQGDTNEPPAANLRLQSVAAGFQSPVDLAAPAGDTRLFVVEQRGVIRIVKNGQILTTPFLDIRSKITSGGEQGLLSVAFHPNYASNGFFYVDYTDVNGDTRVERYHVSSNADVADPASGKQILFIGQPYSNHNGGMLLFGPDGMLYVGMGDGGGGGDPQGNGQNRNSLLGKLLRIDIDGGDPYRIPPDNPFVGQSGMRGEIWAWGLRNPWRYAFDRQAGLLYIADVGQNQWEEVNVVAANNKGVNYGWNIMEGTHCYGGGSCSTSNLVLPVLEYSHADGCSITGGFVYRGVKIPAIQGHYFYADYCNGWVRSFQFANGTVTNAKQWGFGSIGNVLSFGEDGAGELYVLSDNGTVYQIVNQ